MRRKWRRWIKVIDDTILDRIRENRVIFEKYYALVEANTHIRTPWNFHEWVLGNHGRSLMLQVRQLVDTDSRTYSLRKLLGEIALHSDQISKRGFLRAYPAHHRHLAEANWRSHVGGSTSQFLPRGVPYADIEYMKGITVRINRIVNAEVAHLERARRNRSTDFDEVYGVVRRLVSIAAKYGDLLGVRVADDLDNFVIAYDWMTVFDMPWRLMPTRQTP